MGFKSGDCDGHSRIFHFFFWSQALVDLWLRWGLLAIIVLLEGPMLLQLHNRRHDDFLILDWTHRAPHTPQVSSATGSKAAPEHHWATAMLHCRQGVLFSICFILLFPDIPLIHRPKKFQFCLTLHRTEFQNFGGLFIWFSPYWSRLFLCFWVSSGVRLENRAWN